VAHPVWLDGATVDLKFHVRRVRVPAPGTQAELERCVAGLHARLMDRRRPLWMMYVLDGLADGRRAYYFKVHHAVLDGQAGVLLAQALFDVTPQIRNIPPGKSHRAEHPGMAQLAAAALKHDAGQYIKLIRHLPDVARTLYGMFGKAGEETKGRLGQNFSFGPKTPLNTPITGERGFAALSIPLDTLQRIATAHEAKLNDVVLALCSGALRRYLAHHGGIPKKPLIAAMPISLRQAGNTEYTTQATMSLVNLNTQIADPVRRLRAIRDAAGAVKALAKRARGVLPTDFPSIGTPWLLHGLASLYGRSGLASAMPPIANVVISNVPGPTAPLYAAGARMATYWPLSIPEHGLGLNITVMSYAGAMGFGFTTARAAVPDARKLSAALTAALDELVARSAGARPRTTRARAAQNTDKRRRPAVPARQPSQP
jgi:diacylglycerol O-acyltransferase